MIDTKTFLEWSFMMIKIHAVGVLRQFNFPNQIMTKKV